MNDGIPQDQHVRGVSLNSRNNPRYYKTYIMINNANWDPAARPSSRNQPHLKLDLGSYSFGRLRTREEAFRLAVAHRRHAEQILYPNGLGHVQAYKRNWQEYWEDQPEVKIRLSQREVNTLGIPEVVYPTPQQISDAKKAPQAQE